MPLKRRASGSAPGCGWQLPLALAHEAVDGAQVAAGGDQQADGQVGHVLGQRAQRGGDRQAAGAAVRQVHRVGADPVDGHHLQAGQLLEHRARDAGVAAGDHGVDAGAVPAQPGLAIGGLEMAVHGVLRRQCIVDLGHQDRVELQDLGWHGRIVD
jgi:hypothetical protein